MARRRAFGVEEALDELLASLDEFWGLATSSES